MTGRTELLGRIGDFEDGFTERKPEGAASHEIRQTLVAFANSVPPGRTAVLFLGVSDKGDILGLSNPDKQQKTLRGICERDCYPAILYQTEVLTVEGKPVLAVVVSESPRRPHFAGGAFVRRGSENVNASEAEFRQLLLSQVDKCREIMRHKGADWIVRAYGRMLDNPRILERNVEEGALCRIEDVNPFYVRFRKISGSSSFSVELAAISLSWDEMEQRPMAIIRPILYASST